MNINLKNLAALLLGILIVLAMVRLGFWQLDRASYKQGLLETSIRLSKSPPIDLSGEYKGRLEAFQSAEVSGSFLEPLTFAIDNQVRNNQVGIYVVTPLKISGSGKVVLINRGWLPFAGNRQSFKIPALPKSKSTRVSGRFAKPYAKPPIWDDAFDVIQDGKWQYLDIDIFRKNSGLDVLPLVLELAPQSVSGNGLEQSWPTPEASWVNRHKAYALQWFSMAICLGVIIIVLQVRRRQNPSDEIGA